MKAEKITLKTLLDKSKPLAETLGLTDVELVTRWRMYFTSQAMGEAFDSLVMGEAIDPPKKFDIDAAVDSVANRARTISTQARSFVLATTNPANIGKPTEVICKELGIDYQAVIEESTTSAYQDYVDLIRQSDLSQLMFMVRKTLLIQLENTISKSPAAGIKLLTQLAEHSNLSGMLGLPAPNGSADGKGMQVEMEDAEFSDSRPPIIEADFTIIPNEDK